MCLAVTRIFAKRASDELSKIPDDLLMALKSQDQFYNLLKIIRYQIIFNLPKDPKRRHGELKAERNELKGSPHNIKCDCFLN